MLSRAVIRFLWPFIKENADKNLREDVSDRFVLDASAVIEKTCRTSMKTGAASEALCCGAQHGPGRAA